MFINLHCIIMMMTEISNVMIWCIYFNNNSSHLLNAACHPTMCKTLYLYICSRLIHLTILKAVLISIFFTGEKREMHRALSGRSAFRDYTPSSSLT